MSDSGESTRSAQAISNAITKLQPDHYDRGPESVRTVVGYDHIICFLENTFMPVERTLIDAGEGTAVRETWHSDISVEVFVLERDSADVAPAGLP